jgi:hypothetical protein
MPVWRLAAAEAEALLEGTSIDNARYFTTSKNRAPATVLETALAWFTMANHPISVFMEAADKSTSGFRLEGALELPNASLAV